MPENLPALDEFLYLEIRKRLERDFILTPRCPANRQRRLDVLAGKKMPPLDYVPEETD